MRFAFSILLLALPALAQSGEPQRFVVAAPVADMHKAPSADSEVVSQAIFSSSVTLLEREEEWAKIRTEIDGYLGWVRAWTLAKENAEAPYASGRTAIVTSLFANLYREPNIEHHRPVMTVPFEARLAVETERVEDKVLYYEVRLPDGSKAFVQSGDVAFETKPVTIDEAIALGKRFIGLPYLWGGTTSKGYDCSGYTQMLMRQRGYLIPRDSSVQARWEGSATVDRAELQPGDLLYFGRPAEKKVNHTGMYIGDGQFIHATRAGRPSVQIGTLEDPHWSGSFVTARRVK
ncbi:MAG TPA: C40 family peptidase [Thermoanaerobaculia bacterium]|nr:C40 family peptidase [Thermoanaerobaculia bacterium]